jgi:hypothetical protein
MRRVYDNGEGEQLVEESRVEGRTGEGKAREGEEIDRAPLSAFVAFISLMFLSLSRIFTFLPLLLFFSSTPLSLPISQTSILFDCVLSSLSLSPSIFSIIFSSSRC